MEAARQNGYLNKTPGAAFRNYDTLTSAGAAGTGTVDAVSALLRRVATLEARLNTHDSILNTYDSIITNILASQDQQRKAQANADPNAGSVPGRDPRFTDTVVGTVAPIIGYAGILVPD